jgi:ribosomal protein S11
MTAKKFEIIFPYRVASIKKRLLVSQFIWFLGINQSIDDIITITEREQNNFVWVSSGMAF